jgi:hypothetical protein
MIYMMTIQDKWLLISESRSDSNRYTSWRGNLMHMTRTRSWQVVHCNLSRWPNRFRQTILLSRKKAPDIILSTPVDRSAGPPPSFSPPPTAIEAVIKVNHLLTNMLHQFIRLITTVCDLYVQYLLMGANPSVLNRHRQGLALWRS